MMKIWFNTVQNVDGLIGFDDEINFSMNGWMYFDVVSNLLMLPPCHFLLYSSNTIVTLTEETNRLSHSDTKKLDHSIQHQ